MAKSARSKVKRSFRAKKRQEGVYAATEAARLHRLSQKLRSIVTSDVQNGDQKEGEEEDADMQTQRAEGDVPDEAADGQAPSGDNANGADAMDLDSSSSAGPSNTKISTHGPRGSRREHWRLSKGMPARASSKGINRQGGVAARRKSGRSHRRR